MTIRTDEGMWLLNDPPRELLQEKYGFDLTDSWLEHARLAAVRFNNGGSGSFISADGLIITNHHVGADSLHKLSSAGRNYLRDGFHARSWAEEARCPELELNVLREIVDVTARVSAAVKSGTAPAEAFAARRRVMAEIEKESLEQTGLRSDVVTLYQGGIYHLYRYKKYTDVRLVFAPEQAIAAFGGDTDNFEFPRYCLDICFFRAYENGSPAKVSHWLKWNAEGPGEGELVFVLGQPGTTNRLETLAKLHHRRDVTLPYTLARLRAVEAALTLFSNRGSEQSRPAAHDLHRAANARKAFAGQYQGLLDPAILARKEREEALLQQAFFKPGGGFSGDPWRAIADAQARLATFEREHSLFERGDGFLSELFTIARHLVRLTAELEKPSPERLREYRDSNLESLRFQLFSPAPIYPELERVKLTAALTFLAEQLTVNHSQVERVLAGRPPHVRAAELIAGTRLAEVAERQRLADGGAKAVHESNDPMIRLALLVDDYSRALRKRSEDEVEEVERQAYAQIAAVRFATLGRRVAPDATFTLRLAFGVVRGYEAEGERVPFRTTLGGAFERADLQGSREPFVLPRRWLEGKEKLDLAAPFCFVSMADTIGGNSGSPVLNRAGEFVGINFDRNRYGLVRNFVYTDEQARHIAVHSRGIVEALRALYDCEALLGEIGCA